MAENNILNTLYNLWYYQSECNRIRDRPLNVLCLGFSRTGTESLSQALSQLGYNTVYHGFSAVASAQDACFWARLALAHSAGHPPDPALFSAQNFDRALGHCSSATDVPCVYFGIELLHAYPDAKVVLNRRRDVDAWSRSIEANFVPILTSWAYWVRHWLDTKAFWNYKCHEYITRPCYMLENFNTEVGRSRYEEHYSALEQVLQAENRAYLDFYIDEGWAPLCAFLGKPLPETEFPSGNDMKALAATRARLQKETNARIKKRLVTGGIFIAAVAILFVRSWPSISRG